MQQSDNKKIITIIDTFGFLFKSFYALPYLKSRSGFPTGMLTGFLNFILNINKDFKTDYLVFTFDSKGNTFRNELYSNYKANRNEAPEDLLVQLPVAISWVEQMGFKTALKNGFEADDVIASIAQEALGKNLKVQIVSHDKDLYQLIDDKNNVFMFDPQKKEIIDEKKCFEKYGIHSYQFIDYQALVGDSADNIPGVKGIGAKTAQALLNEFKTLEEIYGNIENIEKPRWKTLLIDNKEMAYISKKLVTLDKNAFKIEKLDEYELPKINPILKIEDILMEYDFNSIIQRVKKHGLSFKTITPQSSDKKIIEKKEIEKIEFESVLVDCEDELLKIIDTIPADSIVAFDTETTSLDTSIAQIVGFSFCYNDEKAYYIPINHNYLGVGKQISQSVAKSVIERLNNFKLVVQNFKYDFQIVKNNFAIELNLYADTMILSHLLDTQDKNGLDYLAQKYFRYQMIEFKNIVKKDETFANVNLEEACKYASEDAFVTFKTYHKQLEEFEARECEELLDIAKKYEFEFIKVLAYIEEIGIKIDTKLLKELKVKNSEYISTLTKEIHKHSSSSFNINSPKQLGVVLFEELNLPTSKKTKTGYSTNEQVLNLLLGAHDIIKPLIEYREAYKLQTTYIEPILDLCLKNNENRIYTSFLQTGTTTGRLSSKNPNLQNIPVKSEAGRKIRDAFIAKDGYVLVGLDYSQIELRLLAHFSGDSALVDAFKNNLDIHLQTAIKIFGEDKAANKRNIAKSINFGLLYGMGSKKLSETLGISTKEAKEYIEAYFKAFSSVKDYFKSIEDFVQESGYVQTLLKRRRFFNFSNANAMMKAMFLREAINSKFQGSAADLIKLSMIEIYKKYKDNSDVKMLLQIHDELIFEVRESKAETIGNELKDIMENIYNLNVPLEVSINYSLNWGGLK